MKTLRQFKEEYQIDEISSKVLHKYFKMEPSVKINAIQAELDGDKKTQSKADQHLKNMSKNRNNQLFPKPKKSFNLATESIESDIQRLDNHVTNTMPDNENITKMHDMIHDISKTYGISANKLYDNIKDNSIVHQKYRDAATDE